MKSTTFLVSLALCLGVGAGRAGAVMIDLVPRAETVLLGKTASVDIVVSGLGDFAAPSLGGFDLEVSLSDSLLALSDVAFGAFLGDVSAFEAIVGSGVIPGGFEVSALSFLLPPALDAIQPDTFTLATLSLDAIGVGGSPMVLSRVELVDGWGAPVLATATPASLRVVGAAVPEPQGTLLLVPALLGAWWIGRGGARRARRRCAR